MKNLGKPGVIHRAPGDPGSENLTNFEQSLLKLTEQNHRTLN